MFVNLAIPGLTLRRPMSVCAINHNSFTIIYRVVGKGTEILKQMLPNQSINILMELGNFYTYQKSNGDPVIVAAGCGLGSVLGLAQ
jgi:dihydroorotate dehydrogenase electron transfer subunit